MINLFRLAIAGLICVLSATVAFASGDDEDGSGHRSEGAGGGCGRGSS